MSEHDPLCPASRASIMPTGCQCDLIAKVRDNQRGFDIRQQVEERDRFRAEVAALRDVVTPNVDFFYQKGRTLAFQQVLKLIDGSNGG